MASARRCGATPACLKNAFSDFIGRARRYLNSQCQAASSAFDKVGRFLFLKALVAGSISMGRVCAVLNCPACGPHTVAVPALATKEPRHPKAVGLRALGL